MCMYESVYFLQGCWTGRARPTFGGFLLAVRRNTFQWSNHEPSNDFDIDVDDILVPKLCPNGAPNDPQIQPDGTPGPPCGVQDDVNMPKMIPKAILGSKMTSNCQNIFQNGPNMIPQWTQKQPPITKILICLTLRNKLSERPAWPIDIFRQCILTTLMLTRPLTTVQNTNFFKPRVRTK